VPNAEWAEYIVSVLTRFVIRLSELAEFTAKVT